MNNLTKKSNEEICEFFLNGKSGNCTEQLSDTKNVDNFTNRIIYKDKNIEIQYSYRDSDPDNIQFTIISDWWGLIKNSFFTLEGSRGKLKNKKIGVINMNELKNSNHKSTHIINNKNKMAAIDVTNFTSYVAYCQRNFEKSPSYSVKRIISQTPSVVEIEIILIDGSVLLEQGPSKIKAANIFAEKMSEKIKAEKASKKL